MLFIIKKIRYALLSNGNFSKYSLYAAGEIFLVVIGILIALAIDDWQTDKQNRAIEQDYYCQILADFELDKTQLDNLRAESHKDIATGKQLIIAMNTMNKDKDELLHSFINVARTIAYVPTIASYTDLISSGNISLLENQQLKRKIISFYNELAGMNESISSNRAFRTNKSIQSWGSVLELGWQSPAISPLLNLDEDFIKLLPNEAWHLDKENPYFKQVIEVTFVSMTVAGRDIEWFNTIEEKMRPLQTELARQCNSSE